MSKYNVEVGTPIEAQPVSPDVGDDQPNVEPKEAKILDARLRFLFGIIVTVILAIVILGAIVLGLHDGTYDEIGAVWEATENILFLLFGGVFGSALVMKLIGNGKT